MKNKKLLSFGLFLNIILIVFIGIMYDVTLNQNVFDNNPYAESIYFIGSVILLLTTIVLIVMFLHEESTKYNKIVYPLVSAIIGSGIATLAFVYSSMYPFGDNNIMMVDMWGQYTPMLADFKSLLTGDGNLFYTNQIGLGTGYLPLFGYYLASPFNLLLILFPIEFLPQAFMLITILKIGFCAAAFTSCAQYLYSKTSISTITCGVMYSGMFFILAYSWCIMWLDALIMLPICVMLLEKMLKTRKILAYSVVLGITVALNFYMAFIVCIFLFLYWLVWVFKEERRKSEVIQSFKVFMIGSLIGGGLSAIITIPVILGLQGTSAANDALPMWKSMMPLFNIPTQMLYNSELTIRSGNYANIGCGVLSIVSVALYFTTKDIPVRRRIVYGCLLAILVLSLTINRLDLIWHGFHTPNDLPYRYSFIYSFVVLLITCDLMQYAHKLSLHTIAKTAAVVFVWLVISDVVGEERLSFSMMFVSLFLMSIYFGAYALCSYKKQSLLIEYVVFFIVVLEVLSQSSIHRFQMDSQEGYGSHSNWTSNENIARQSVADAFNELSDEAFYRSEILPLMTFQDSALFGFDGISSFASTYYYTTTKTMKNLGYESNGINSSVYRSFMPTIDSLLGIQYVALRTNLDNYKGLTKVDEFDLSQDGWYIYENETSLSLGYVGTEQLKNYTSTKYDPIETQNELYAALTGIEDQLFLLNPLKAVDNASYNASEITINETSFSIPNKGASAVASFEVEIEHPGHVFIYIDCGAANDIVVNGVNSWNYPENQPYFIDNSHRVIGDKVTIDITNEGVSGNIYVATINEEVFQSSINKIRENEMTVNKWEDGLIEGEVTAQEDGIIMLTIPYDKGWSMWVDNKKVEVFAIDEAFIGANISEGTHTIKLKYTPPGFIIGCAISLSCAILLVIMNYKKKIKWLKGSIS